MSKSNIILEMMIILNKRERRWVACLSTVTPGGKTSTPTPIVNESSVTKHFKFASVRYD